MIIITDPNMANKMSRALKLGGDLFTLEDIENGLISGDMQSHVMNDTWAITRVHQWPRKKSVDILFTVGDMAGSLLLEQEIDLWAKEIGADLITATGREGWWKYRTPGWKKVGVLYSKDISHEQR